MITVEDIKGRYPARPKALQPEAMDAQVLETEPGVYIVRLDDLRHDEFWLQFTVRLDPRGP